MDNDKIKINIESITYDDIFCKKTPINAFTLAEVLITLGIIGVVAAMVLPTLMNNVQDKVLETQTGKSKSIIANGYKLMMAKSSVMDVDNLPFLSECINDISCMSREHKKVFNIVDDSSANLSADSLPSEYLITGETDKSPFKWEDVPYMFASNDGMIYGVIPDDNRTSFDVVVDVNGVKNPNTAIKDLHKYRYNGHGALYDVSSELTQVGQCSYDNLSACRSYEECNSLNTCNPTGHGFSWQSDRCVVEPFYTVGICRDE